MNAMHPGGQVICLITAPNPFQAHLWENVLRAAGIKFQIVGDFLGLGIGDHCGIQPEIWVRRQDWLRAKHVLRQYSQAEAADSLADASCRPGCLS